MPSRVPHQARAARARNRTMARDNLPLRSCVFGRFLPRFEVAYLQISDISCRGRLFVRGEMRSGNSRPLSVSLITSPRVPEATHWVGLSPFPCRRSVLTAEDLVFLLGNSRSMVDRPIEGKEIERESADEPNSGPHCFHLPSVPY